MAPTESGFCLDLVHYVACSAQNLENCLLWTQPILAILSACWNLSWIRPAWKLPFPMGTKVPVTISHLPKQSEVKPI